MTYNRHIHSTKSTAHWDAILAVSTGTEGLKVTIIGSTVPVYGQTQVNGYYTGVAAADPGAGPAADVEGRGLRHGGSGKRKCSGKKG